jgi:UDP-4-amino-4-deoxy-L-arabinose formyltransferase/UDP-glucuronic acid dehydrogenase (UDP-4-keto-hexauronic acid decarboxylating)
MKVAAFAYHNMGIAGLNALERSGFQIACIFSHENDPTENCWFGSVKEWGRARRIPVECPADIGGRKWEERIAALHPEMIFSFYYRHMIREELLRIPPKGAYNLHGSLLPAYRGRCPVNWVLVNGEARTGVTLHHMVRKADAGDIVGQKVVPITADDTALTLYGKLCDASEILLDELLPLMKIGLAPRIPQDISQGSYFGGRRPEDGRIDWDWPAARIYNLIRAVTDPYPGAFCGSTDGSRLMIWWGTPVAARDGEMIKPPGSVEIAEDRVLVWTGEGKIRLLNVQAGGERMNGDGITRYFMDREGMLL